MNTKHPSTSRLPFWDVCQLILLMLLFALLLAPGCAAPRRAATTSHIVERFAGRPDGLVQRETWSDGEKGGGLFLFTDPNVQGMSAQHVNQSALGGSNSFVAGSLTLVVDTNTAAIIGAGGTAVGNIIGASVKAAVR